MKNTPSTRSNVIVLKQLLNHIPRGMINRHALETGVETKARSFSVLSHLSAMLFAHLSHAMGLNDVCDWLRLKAGVLARFGVTPPSKNGLSNANKERSADFVEKLFWSVLGHLQHNCPSFTAGRKGKGLLRRFKVRIHAVDSTVIQLVANCMDWAKDNMAFRVVKNHTKGHENIIKDQIIALKGRHQGMQLRRVEAWVEVDGKWRTMVLITNNLAWSPQSVCDLYRRRWDIEVFFKQVKQSLKLGSFLGHSANAVRWQVYTALLVYVLLRFMAHLSEWGHSFTRLFAVTRSALWERLDLLALLKSYGTASGRFKVIGALDQAWFADFAPAKT